MKKVIANTIKQPESIVEIDSAIEYDTTNYIGYESEGGLRAYATTMNGRSGFMYYNAGNNGRNTFLKFEAPSYTQCIKNAFRAGRELYTFDNLTEFTQWLDKSIATRRGPEYIVDLMQEHGINPYKVISMIPIKDKREHIVKQMKVLDIYLKDIVEFCLSYSIKIEEQRTIEGLVEIVNKHNDSLITKSNKIKEVVQIKSSYTTRMQIVSVHDTPNGFVIEVK